MEKNEPTILTTSIDINSVTAVIIDAGGDKDKDNISIKSSDSVTTSGEYEIVPETPQLNLPKDISTTAVDSSTPTNNSSGIIKKKTVPLSPILNIAGDMTEMERNLTDVIKELDADEREGIYVFYLYIHTYQLRQLFRSIRSSYI